MHRQNRGFTIVELVVTAGIIGVLGMMLASMLGNSVKTQKSVGQSFDFQNLASLIKMALVDPNKCKLALLDSAGNIVVPPTPNATTFDVGNIPISKIAIGSSVIADTAATNQSFTITSMTLVQVVAGNPNTLMPYTMQLKIVGSKGAAAVGGSSVSIQIPIAVTITNTPSLSTCSTDATAIPAGTGATFNAYMSPGCTSATGTTVSSPTGNPFTQSGGYCSISILPTQPFNSCQLTMSGGICGQCNIANLGGGMYSLTAGACNNVDPGGSGTPDNKGNGFWGMCQMTCY